MLPRFSYLASLPYDQHLIANKVMLATSQLPDGPDKAIIQSVLYGNTIGAQATIRSGQEVVSAIGESTSQMTDAIGASTSTIASHIDKAALANIFGSLLTAGTIAASAIIISRKMDSLAVGLDRLAVGIDRLGAQFSEGMALITTQLDIQSNKLVEIRDQLSRIHETLKSPAFTQAAEWRNIGLDRFGSGLWLEAISAFEKALNLDETDPVSNVMLGKIYLDAVDHEQNLHDPMKSQSYFQKAQKYASALVNRAPELKQLQVEALYLCATAILVQSTLDRIGGKSEGAIKESVQKAETDVNRLLEINPGHKQGMYLLAKIKVLMNEETAAADILNELVRSDPQFLVPLLNDPDIVKFSTTGKKLLEGVEVWYRSELSKEMDLFFDGCERAHTWQVSLPEELLGWLKRELIATRVEARQYAAARSLDVIIGEPVVLLLAIREACRTMDSLVQHSIQELSATIAEFKAGISKRLRTLNWDFIFSVQADGLSPEMRIERQLSVISEMFRSYSEFDSARTSLAKMEADIQQLAAESEAMVSAFEGAKALYVGMLKKSRKQKEKRELRFLVAGIAGGMAIMLLIGVLYPSLGGWAYGAGMICMVAGALSTLRNGTKWQELGFFGTRQEIQETIFPRTMKLAHKELLYRRVVSAMRRSKFKC